MRQNRRRTHSRPEQSMGAPSSPAPPSASPPHDKPAADPSSPPVDPPTSLVRLRCGVQHYAWGRHGRESLVARLSGTAEPDADLPLAELWMGTHPAAPSAALPDCESLGAWLALNPAALGPAVATRWAGDLPYLFKVLSVAKPLSIEVHPYKSLAELLYAVRPATYREDNHKPEMAIAVIEFRVLFGFASIEALRKLKCKALKPIV